MKWTIFKISTCLSNRKNMNKSILETSDDDNDNDITISRFYAFAGFLHFFETFLMSLHLLYKRGFTMKIKIKIYTKTSLIKQGKGQNYENQNVENQKELRKLRRRSERRKDKLKRSERRKANYQNVEKRIITMSKRVDHYYENHNVKKNVESRKTTFGVVIILNAIGKIRTSKV